MDFKVVELNLKKQKSPKTRKGKSNERKRGKRMKSTLKKTEKGITLVALVVTIIVLLILAGVSIATLFGENGIITMAQKAKKETEEASKKEQQQLAGVFERNYVTYNGQLHVENSKLVNEFGEDIQLKGCVLSSISADVYSKENLSYLKSLGANIVRLGLNPSDVYDEKKMNSLYKVIDICIDLDMYADIIFWNSNDINANVLEAKVYFNNIIEKYKDSPNLLYEIFNEPTNTVKWSQIVNYAEEIIPLIKEKSPSAVILVGTPYSCLSPNIVIENELDFDNIMYTFHKYMDGTNDYTIFRDNLQIALLNKIPIFVTEWSATNSACNELNIEEANEFMNIIDNHKLNWIYGGFSESDGNMASMIKKGEWGNTISDSALTESGQYARRLLNGTNKKYAYKDSDYTMVNGGRFYSTQYFWNEKYKNKIVEINFINNVQIPENVIDIWDISYTGLGNVLAYIVEDNNEYILYISSKNETFFPDDSGLFFMGFSNLENINFANINTNKVTNMQVMFADCTKLKDLDLSIFCTDNVANMGGMFRNCTLLEDINLSNFNTSTVSIMESMFSNAKTLKEINLSSFDMTNVTNSTNMFAGITPHIIVRDAQTKDIILNIKETLTVTIIT